MLILFILLFCLPVCMCVCMYTSRAWARRGYWSPLDLYLWTVMSHYVDAGNWLEVLNKNSKCSQQLSHLSTPSLWYFKFIYSHTLPSYSEILEINRFESIIAVKGRRLVAPVKGSIGLKIPHSRQLFLFCLHIKNLETVVTELYLIWLGAHLVWAAPSSGYLRCCTHMVHRIHTGKTARYIK